MTDEASPPLPTFAAGEKVCGNCRLWVAHSLDHRGWVGACRLLPNRGLFPPAAPACESLALKGAPAPEALKQAPERRRSVTVSRGDPLRRIQPLVVKRDRDSNPNEQIDLEGLSMTREELMDLFREAAGDVSAPPLAQKWEGGTIKLVPSNPELQAKELPIESLLHKVVMIRDRLRTLEQKINGSAKLSDGEKVELQHYITRCYGSLTTFNVLFKEKGDQFVGQKGDD